MKILYLDNIASHYRKAVFMLMDKTFQIDYLFGASYDDIKEMDTSLLTGKVEKSQTVFLPGKSYWQPGLVNKLFKLYDYYLLVGETRAFSTWVFCILACLIGKRNKVFFWTHGWYGKETTLQKVTKKFFLRLAGGGIFLYGNYARNIMIREGFKPEKLYVIHNSLDYSKQLVLRNQCVNSTIYREHFGNNNPIIIMIGRLNIRKHLDMLFEAVARLKEEGVLYNVVLIGDGDDKGKLLDTAQKLKIKEQVWFYGACYDEATNANLIYNADLCVVPGDIGLTAMHSLMFGTPVVTHNHFPFQGPEFESIVPGQTGDFYEYGDVGSLAVTIQKWFETHVSRGSVRKSCYHVIDSEWTPEYQINILKEHLK